ncbi:MAG: MarR family transcriptional regulator [Phycisphaerae bacterium]
MGSKMPSSTQAVDGLFKALLVLSRAVDQVLETRAVKAVANKPLSGSKVQILRLLSSRGSQTSSQVARFLGVSKPAVTQIVDSMERARLVVRRSTKRDRREVALELTKQGKLQQQAVRRRQRQLVRNAIRSSKMRDVSREIDTLQRIASALAEADQGFDQYCLQCGAHDDETCILTNGDADCLFQRHTGPKRSKR